MNDTMIYKDRSLTSLSIPPWCHCSQSLDRIVACSSRELYIDIEGHFEMMLFKMSRSLSNIQLGFVLIYSSDLGVDLAIFPKIHQHHD